MDSLTVNVVTPNGLVYDHHAKIVVAKTTDGEIGILPKHAPIIVPLAIDEVRIKRTDSDTHVDWVAVNGGIMKSVIMSFLLLPIVPNVNEISMCLVLNEQNNEQNV